MSRPLRLLMLEDSDDDAVLLLLELESGGFDVSYVRVESADQLRDALAKHTFDLAITDYAMPCFTGIEGLAIIREDGRDLPVIMASGTVGEEAAVAALKAGAEDFIVKGRMARLLPAVERALRQAEQRAERIAAQAETQTAIRQRIHADATSKAKSDFLANVSHELRTPLNVIIGFSELLEHGDDGALNPRQAEHVGNILTSARHLLAVISDLLDVSKVEAGQMSLSLEPTSFAKVANALQVLLRPMVLQRQVELVLSIPPDLPLVPADPLRLRQVLYNLLSNALKFTEPSGTVRLTASVRDDRLVVAVSDTGIGIRKENLDRLFQEFEQIDPSERSKIEGSGLGLLLTRRLVELHGGTIHAESEWGKGSTFTVLLPLQNEACLGNRRSSTPAAPASASTESLRILVVEDDPASGTLVKLLLGRRGHEVLLATSAADACAVLADQPVQLVLTDLHVSGGGGARVLAELRACSNLAHVPIVVVTAHAMRGVREQLLAQGFDGYLSKPIDARSFAKTVEAFVPRLAR